MSAEAWIVIWVLLVAITGAFNYGAHKGSREPDEKYTDLIDEEIRERKRKKDEEEVIF